MALVFFSALLRFGLSPLFVRNLIFGGCLLALSAADLESLEIPGRLPAIAAAAFLLFLPFSEDPSGTLLSGLSGGFFPACALLLLSLLADRLLGRKSLGGGDIWLVFVAGLYLGPDGSLFMLLLACFLGLIFIALRKDREIPFGPPISAAAWIILLYGRF